MNLVIQATKHPGWWAQLFGDPIAVFASLAFLAAAAAATASMLAARTARHQQLDSAGPRLALSLSAEDVVIQQVNPLLHPRWLGANEGLLLPLSTPRSIFVHAVARVRNDGNATAYVRFSAAVGADTPIWEPQTQVLKVSDDTFTIPPEGEAFIDLYAGRIATDWIEPKVEIRWQVEVDGRAKPGVRDTSMLDWAVEGASKSVGSDWKFTGMPSVSCTVAPWRRAYTRG